MGDYSWSTTRRCTPFLLFNIFFSSREINKLKNNLWRSKFELYQFTSESGSEGFNGRSMRIDEPRKKTKKNITSALVNMA